MGFLGTSDGRSSMRSTPVQLVCRPQRLGNASHDAKTYRLQDPMLVPKVYAPECAERLSKKRTFLRADGSECLVARPLAASTGIGAGAARLGAVKACLYALDERIGVHDSYGARIGVEHFPSVSHWGFPFPRTWVQCNKARKRSA